MNNNLFMVAIFWGVWIIIPVLFDGVLAFFYMLTIVFYGKKNLHHQLYEKNLPRVSIIVPTYNEEENINECLTFLTAQNYPQDKMEIIVVDNGSTDQTPEIVKNHIREIWLKKNGGTYHEVVTFSPEQKNKNNATIKVGESLKFPQDLNESYSSNVVKSLQQTGALPKNEQKVEHKAPDASTNQPSTFDEHALQQLDAQEKKQSGYTLSSNAPSSLFGGLLKLVVRYDRGKAKALNTGISLSQGEIIINIDCRSFLDVDAVRNTVAKFIEYPQYGALTGNIEIDWQMFYLKEASGNYRKDDQGKFIARALTHKEKFLAKSQFLEYLTSFRLGRQFQDITGSMFTFAGAYSAFRREVLLHSAMYQDRTVAEDTDLTLDLQGRSIRLGFVSDAKIYLKPVLSFERFYAQRIRWHRGQLEVIGLHLDWYGDLRKGFWRNFWLSFLLMLDHTFGFPRIIWIFLLPLFFLFGYSWTLIVQAIILMYVFYIFIDFLNSLYCYRVSDKLTQEKIKDSIQYCFVTPFFRILTYMFRFSAYLEELKEPQAWTTTINPVRSVKDYGAAIRGGYKRTVTFGDKVWHFISGQKPEEQSIYYEEKMAEEDWYGRDQNSRK